MSLLEEMETRGLADCAYNRVLFESEIIDNVYDYIFKNDQYNLIDFCAVYPASWIDNAHAVIYIGIEENKPLYKIKIERV
jgi:hypothetical protein